MSSRADHTPIYTQLLSLTLHPYHFTREEAAGKHGVIVQTIIAIFDVPTGTRGTVVHSAKTHDDGYSVAIEWQLASDADSTPSPEPITDWFTKSEYERYVIEIKTKIK